jgi:hypothetical protein
VFTRLSSRRQGRPEYRLNASFSYAIGTLGSGLVITLPVGFVTDFASVPGWADRFGLHPDGLYAKAAALHDWLYCSITISRFMADIIFFEAMRVLRVSLPVSILFFITVRLFGARSFATKKGDL